MVPRLFPLCIRKEVKQTNKQTNLRRMCLLFISSFPASEVSPPLAGCLCGVNWELQFLGWLGLLYSGSSATGSGSLWNGWWKYAEVSVYFSPMPWKKKEGIWIAPVSVSIDFAWQFIKYCKFPSKIGFEFLFFFFCGLCGMFQFLFFFFWEVQLTFCAEGHDWFCTVVAIWANLI